jgi:ketosteroid isomerase-like protein
LGGDDVTTATKAEANRKLMEDMLAAFRAGDMAAFTSNLTPDIVWILEMDLVLRVDIRDGKWARVQEYIHDLYAWDDFWS